MLSVCIPTYNGALYLGEAMKSVLDQSYADFELIVVDDASSDATVDIARSFTDPRIRHVSNRVNRGLVGNWNRCIDLARGSYLCIFHQDDVMMPGNLAAKVSVLDRHPTAGFVHSNVLQVGPGGELLSEWWAPRPGPEHGDLNPGAAVLGELLRGGNIVCAPSVVIRKDCLDALGPFDGRLPYTADWEMWMRATVFFDVGYVRQPLVKYRRHAGNETLKFLGPPEREHAYRAKVMVLEKCGQHIPGAEALKAELARQYGEFVGGTAVRGESDGSPEAERGSGVVAGGEPAPPQGGEEAPPPAVGAELEQVGAELNLLRGRIAAMESSKFWKLRRWWFCLKRALGRPGEE